MTKFITLSPLFCNGESNMRLSMFVININPELTTVWPSSTWVCTPSLIVMECTAKRCEFSFYALPYQRQSTYSHLFCYTFVHCAHM